MKPITNYNKVGFFTKDHVEKYRLMCAAAVETQKHIKQRPPAKDEHGHTIVYITHNDYERQRVHWGDWLLERGPMVIYSHHFGESLVMDRFGCVFHRGQLLVYLPQYHQLRELSGLDWVSFDSACIEMNERLKQKFPDETFSKEMVGLFVVMAKIHKKEWDGNSFVPLSEVDTEDSEPNSEAKKKVKKDC